MMAGRPHEKTSRRDLYACRTYGCPVATFALAAGRAPSCPSCRAPGIPLRSAADLRRPVAR